MAKKRRDSRISFLLERFEDVDSINHKKKGGKKIHVGGCECTQSLF